MLVVGHRVHAVERVRHVHEPALAPDLARSSPRRLIPRGIFSLMNRPITSPCAGGLDLLADDHLHAGLCRLRAAPPARRRSRCGRSPRSRPAPRRARSRAAPRPAWRSRGSGRCACAGRRRSAARVRAAARRARGSPCAAWRRAASVRVDLLEPLRRPASSSGTSSYSAGKVARHQLGGRRQLAVRASRRPKKLSTKRRATQRREQPLAGGVERADVERPRVAQRGVGGAGRERLVDVHEVELDHARAVPRPCARRRSAARAGAAGRRSRRRAPRRRRSRAGLPPSLPSSRLLRLGARGAQLPCATRARAPASARARAPARGARGRRARRRRARRGVDLVLATSHGYGVTWAIENGRRPSAARLSRSSASRGDVRGSLAAAARGAAAASAAAAGLARALARALGRGPGRAGVAWR